MLNLNDIANPLNIGGGQYHNDNQDVYKIKDDVNDINSKEESSLSIEESSKEDQNSSQINESVSLIMTMTDRLNICDFRALKKPIHILKERMIRKMISKKMIIKFVI